MKNDWDGFDEETELDISNEQSFWDMKDPEEAEIQKEFAEIKRENKNRMSEALDEADEAFYMVYSQKTQFGEIP
jgi:hypothetical protein